MEYTGGEVFVETLKRQGVEAIFCSPGTEWTPVWETLVSSHQGGDPIPAYYNCRHEMFAAAAAAGFAKKGGGLPVVLLHCSVGLLNAAMVIRGAYLSHIPLVVCSGESVRYTEGEDPEGRGTSWLTGFSDVGGSSRIMAPLVKWSQAVTSRETLAGTMARACQIARMEPQGPVYIAVSKEFLQERRDESLPRIPPPRTCRAPAASDIATIANALLESRNPIVITERIGDQPDAVDGLVDLAEALAVPVFEKTQSAVCNFPKEHPLYLGFDLSRAIAEADLVLAVAAAIPWNPQRQNPAASAKIFFIDDQAPYQRFPYWNYRSDMIMAADPLLALRELVLQVKKREAEITGRDERYARWSKNHDQMLSSWDSAARESRGKTPIDPRWLCYVINERMPPDTIVVRETTSDAPAVEKLIRRTKPGHLFAGSVKGLGSGMGVAMGIKLAAAQRPLLHLVGDGAFNYAPVLPALGFAQEYSLPVLTVVFNNGAYRAMQSAYRSIYPEGQACRTKTFYGVDIAPRPDYAHQMKVFDAHGETVDDPNDIAPALDRAWAEIQKGRSALLNVIVDPLLSESGGS